LGRADPSETGEAPPNACAGLRPDRPRHRHLPHRSDHGSRYGDDAAIEAAMRADAFLVRGNLDGGRVWMRIMQTIKDLQRARPTDGEAMQ